MAYRACDLVLFDTKEVHVLIKIHFPKCCLFDQAVVDLPLDFHLKEEHMIVRSTGEEDLACVKLV